jgi:hypothetical protein
VQTAEDEIQKELRSEVTVHTQEDPRDPSSQSSFRADVIVAAKAEISLGDVCKSSPSTKSLRWIPWKARRSAYDYKANGLKYKHYSVISYCDQL